MVKMKADDNDQEVRMKRLQVVGDIIFLLIAVVGLVAMLVSFIITSALNNIILLTIVAFIIAIYLAVIIKLWYWLRR